MPFDIYMCLDAQNTGLTTLESTWDKPRVASPREGSFQKIDEVWQAWGAPGRPARCCIDPPGVLVVAEDDDDYSFGL